MIKITDEAVKAAGIEFYGKDWQAEHISEDDCDGQWGDMTQLLTEAAAEMKVTEHYEIVVTDEAVHNAGKYMHYDEWQNTEWCNNLEEQFSEVKSMLESAAKHLELL